MASTWPPVKSNTGVNVCKLVAKLLHHDTVLADLLGELMDCHCLIDRSSIASGNILVIHGDPRKVADVIHKVVDETDVKADENDKEVLTVLDSFKERFHSQFETDFEQDNSTFKAAFHRKISDEVKPSILSLTNKDGRLPLSRHQLSYLHCHLDHLREQVRTSWPESAVIINVQNEAKGQGVLVVSSKRHDFQSVINFLNLFMANIKTSSKELDASRALFLSGVKGQRDVMRLQKEHQCQISVILPGHQVLLRAESPTGHRLFLCEGNMAATDCNMLVLPFSENQSGWTATQKRVLDRGLLTTKTELYTNWIGSPPKKRTLILRCPTPEAGETVMLVHLSDPTGGPSSGAEALTQELAQELSKGLAEAVRISEPRGEFIAVPVAMSTRQSLSDNLEFILPVIQDYLAKEVISATVVLYLEKLSVSEKQKLVETLEKRINQNWKVQTDGAAVYEDNFSSPKLVVAGKMKDIETTFSKLQSLDVPSDFQKRACLLNSTNKPRQVRRSPTQESEAVAEDNKDIGKEDDVRTVCVDGLTADDGELCQMYFQNNEQSGGGQLAQKTVVWDDDTQCWMITFEQRDVAARVASRQHTINGQPVDVKLVYTPRVSYPDRLLFHNVSESISRDYLTLYLERITGQEVTDLMYADKAGDVIVVLDEEPDFTQVQKMCRQKKLEGQKLWVSRVPVSNCILLENLSEATSEDTVMYYFSNKRSGGGPVEKVVFQSEQRKCLVFFYNHEVIENILGKTHALDGSQLQVRLYTECLGPSGGRRDASPFTLPSRVEFKDVDKYKMVFIRQSAALQQRLVELLTDLHAKVISADNPLSVECTLTTAVPHASQLAASWTKDVQDAVNSVINMVVVLHQEVMQDVWTETEKAVSAIKPTSKDSALILVLAENRKFIVMGVKNMADELMKQVKQIVTQKEEEAERKKQEVTETRKLKPFQLHLLTDMSFQSEVAKRHPALKVEICIEKGEISYQGLIRDVREAQVEMYELLMAVRSERHTMSNLQKTILSAKGAPDYVVHKFHVDKLEAGEELLPSAQVEDILANPQSSLCYKSKIQSQEVAELSADRERASARECRRQNDDRTQKNDVNDMELASEDRKEIHDEFDMIDEDYIDKVIGKLENPQPDCWLQRSSSSMMQSPSLLDTDVPSYQETGSLSLSHPEDCILNSENPRLGMTPITRLPELPQEQVPHIQGMIVPDVISTHKSSTSEHHYFSSPVPVHPFSNVINIEVQEEESCPQVLSVAEPIWTESAMKIPPQQGMQNEIYPNINEEEEESYFSLESATDTASEDQLSYFFGYDDDEMPTDVCSPKSTVPVSSFSVTESSNVASLKHSCEFDIENSSGSKTNDEDFDYHLQNSKGLTEDSLVQRHKGRARCKPTLKLKIHLKGMSCASENMVNKGTKNGLLLREQNWSPEEQYEEKDIGSENAIVSRHTATDDLQEHNQSSFAGEQNSQKAITTRAEQLIPVKVLLCGQSVSSFIPLSQPLPAKTQSSKLSTDITQTLLGDGEEDKTVCVTGLTAGDEEVCQLYFENTKRSGGGNIAQQGCVWDEMANQFLITFVDRQAAHRVLKRSHTIVNRDIQVKQYVPPPCFKDTVLVTGIPQGTSADCLQTFLESVADMALDIVQMNKAEGKAIVSLADEEADLDHVKHLQQACQKNPLYGHAVLSVQRIPLSHTVLVDNLNPKTKESAILYFFSNKNRNSGGPVTHIKRLNSTSALVHFENYKDAQALVDKGSHILDEFPLKVSLHLDCFPLTAEVTEEKADYCSSLLTGEGVPSIHKENDYENQTQGDQHHLASDEIPLYDHGVGSCEVTEQVQGGSSFHREPSPMERHSRGSSEWKNDRHASYRPDRRWEQHCGSHISQPHWQQPDCFKRHTAFNSPGPSATHLRTSAYRPTPCKFDRGVRVENNRNLHCPLRQQTEYPHVIKKLGSDVVDRFRENKEALRHLATDLRQIHGRFQWKLPGCIDVIALTSDIPEDWCEQVTKKLEKHLIEVNLGKGRNPLPVERESQRLKRLAEGGVDCKEMPIRQIKDQHSDVDLTHTSVTERYRAAMQNRLETESMEILKEKPYTFFEEVIPNVKACQIKVMSKPQVLSIFKEKCKSITLLVDKEKSLVKVRVNTSQYDAMKMKAHVMEFMTKISERYLSRDYMGNKDDKVEANLP